MLHMHRTTAQQCQHEFSSCACRLADQMCNRPPVNRSALPSPRWLLEAAPHQTCDRKLHLQQSERYMERVACLGHELLVSRVAAQPGSGYAMAARLYTGSTLGPARMLVPPSSIRLTS